MSAVDALYVGRNYLAWNEAWNEETGEYLDGTAVVRAAILTDLDEAPGEAVAGFEAISLAYEAGSLGKFEGSVQIEEGATFVVGTHYWLRATATVLGVELGRREWRVRLQRRGPRK